MRPQYRYYLAAAAVVVGTMLFSSKVILAKIAYAKGMEPMPLLALRMLWAIPFYGLILVLDLRKGGRTPCLLDMGLIATFGVVGYYAASVLDFHGIHHISAALERSVLLLYPTGVLILGALFLGRPITGRAVVATVAGYAGILVMLREEFVLGTEPGSRPVLGVLLVVGSAICFAIFLTGSEGMMRRIGSRVFTSLAMMAGGTGILIHYVTAYGIKLPATDAHSMGLGATLGIFCTVVPSYLTAWSVREMGAYRASVVSLIGVALTFLLSAWAIREPFSSLKLAGIALTMAGAAAAMRMKQTGEEGFRLKVQSVR